MNRILWWLISILLVVGSLFWSWVTGIGCPGGPDETYYENGQLEDKGIYRDGESCGEWLEYGETVTYDPC